MEKLEIWGHCWKCGHDTPHARLAVSYFPRIVEAFAKQSDGKVDHRVWMVLLGVYQFGQCKKCSAPNLFVDEYWPRTDGGEEAAVIKTAVDEHGSCKGYSPERHTYPAYNKEPFPRWTHDLEEAQMLLFWEVYTAISLQLRGLAMMGIRAIVDDYANRVIGDVGGFDKKLEKLRTDGHINNTQFEHLQVVVSAGHAASHRGHRPNREQLLTCLQIVEGLLAKERYGTAIETLRSAIPKRSTSPPESQIN